MDRKTSLFLPEPNRLPAIKPSVYKYLHRPTFMQIRQHADELQSYRISIPRSKQILAEYRQFIDFIAVEGVTLEDVIRFQIKDSRLLITENDFPKDLNTQSNKIGAEHHTLWVSDPKVTTAEVDAHIHKWLSAQDLRIDEIVVIRNPVFVQTIPSIEHYHVFIPKQR